MALKEVKDLDKFEFSDVLKLGEGNWIELLVDTKKGGIFHVSPPVGHLKAAAEYLGIGMYEISEYNAGHLVSAMIEVKGKFLIKLGYGGGTSLELTAHIHHTDTQMRRARKLLEKLVEKSEKKGEIIVVGELEDKEVPLGV